ncbi:MAG: SpoIIE family protein phosphatase [Verrucomicrobiales bacterium]|nr:SpoIIE family protein phosphatase [Verrucomicrobiales bacterium]
MPATAAMPPSESAPVAPASPVRLAAWRVDAECAYAPVRDATRSARAFMEAQGLSRAETAAWELALVEAANNAVQHATGPGRRQPVRFEVLCDERGVEVRLTDHTPGFDWPDDPSLPEPESESGRGLFLIRALVDATEYLRGPGANVLVLRRMRELSEAGERGGMRDDPQELAQRLAEYEAALTNMTSELASSYESLTALFRYSAELGAGGDLKDFAGRLVSDLLLVAGADHAVVRLFHPEPPRLELFLTAPPGDRFADDVLLSHEHGCTECQALATRQDIWFKPVGGDGEGGRSCGGASGSGLTGICHPFFADGKPVGTVSLVREGSDQSFTAAQISLLHTFVDFLGIQITNARLLEARTQARLVERELEIAAEIQRALLPASLPSCPPFELAASAEAARQVGGDFYDARPAGPGGLFVVIADVMGKGVPAAFFASMLRNAVRCLQPLYAHPGRLLTKLNRGLFEDLSRVDMFATVQVAYLDAVSAAVVTASAGHSPPLLCTAEGRMERVDAAGLPLGIEPGTIYEETRMPLAPGSWALLYTDGLTEARAPDGALFGEARLTAWLNRREGLRASATARRDDLLRTLAGYRKGTPAADDETFILVCHRP